MGTLYPSETVEEPKFYYGKIMDIENTKHYTTHQEDILYNLLDYFPKNIEIVEPFVGNGDLLPYIKKLTDHYEIYDIDSKLCNKRDTLLNPPDYSGKYVLTNPPYLARNKSKDKTLFDLYNLNDLYKIFIKTLISSNCMGGIVIIPINFLSDEQSEEIRNEFLKHYFIHEINYFTYKIFDYTQYSICQFYFDKINCDETKINIFNKDKSVEIVKTKITGRLFQEFYDEINKTENIVSRVVETTDLKKEATNIKIYCIDNINSKIHAEYNTSPYIGKISDRVFFTMTQPINRRLSDEDQKLVIKEFNKYINIDSAIK